LCCAGTIPACFFYGRSGVQDWQLWLYVISVAALGASVVGAGFVALPDDLRRRVPLLGHADPAALFAWAMVLFVAGIFVTAVALIAGGIDALDSPISP
jgi:hypothetical protein